MRCVLDDRDAAGLEQFDEPPHLHRKAGDVDGDDRSRARCHGRQDVLGCRVQGARIDVDQHGPGTPVDDDLPGCRERPGRDDDLVAGSDAKRFEGEMQRGSRRVQGNRVPGPDAFGEPLLKQLRARARGEPA